MSGIYLHIPFCRKACTYCNFHFSTQLSRKGSMVDCLLREIELRADYFGNSTIESIYFGGGTPSVLDESELQAIFNKIEENFDLSLLKEVTLEANPDDLNSEYLQMLAGSPVNRLSIGIQCLNDEVLKWMNRSHNRNQAIECIENALHNGFELLTADLIYGIPGRKDSDFLSDIHQFADWGLPHFSAYALTIEPRTTLGHQEKTGKFTPMDEEAVARQFELLMDAADKYGYEHYEISNFAKSGKRAIHNSAYWSGKPYLGIGPSAHSYNGEYRSWNISNNSRYMKSIQEGHLPAESEKLSDRDRYNEYVMTKLRLVEGISIHEALHIFPEAKETMMTAIEEFYHSDHLAKTGEGVRLTKAGKLIADRISSELMYV